MCCVPALFVVVAAVHKKFTKSFRANGKKVPSWLLRGLINEPSRCLPIEGQIENWMTVRMGYDSATTSPMGASRTTLRWDSGAGIEKRHSEKTANNLQIFQETVPFYTRDFSYLWGSCFTVKTSAFCRFLLAKEPDNTDIVCGASIEKSVNSVSLERDFFR